VIYPLDSAIQRLNARGLIYTFAGDTATRPEMPKMMSVCAVVLGERGGEDQQMCGICYMAEKQKANMW